MATTVTATVTNIEIVRAVYKLSDYYFQHGLQSLGEYYCFMAMDMAEELNPFEKAAHDMEMRPKEPVERPQRPMRRW